MQRRLPPDQAAVYILQKMRAHKQMAATEIGKAATRGGMPSSAPRKPTKVATRKPTKVACKEKAEDDAGKTGKKRKLCKEESGAGKKESWGICHEASRRNYRCRTGFSSKSFSYDKDNHDGDPKKAHAAAVKYYEGFV